ncbi:MAG TPA: leucyl aminopeptidase [Steroidobacteraceae bacterium]|nr:leucyl aminopeptidase [Steroidobacteraceae bacterium]
MELKAVTGSAGETRSDCLLVGIYESGELSAAAGQLDRRVGKRLSHLVRRGDFAAKLGETQLLTELPNAPAARVLLVGLGPRKNYDRRAYRRASVAAGQALVRTGARHAVSWLAHELASGVDAYYAGRTAAEAVAQVLYRIPDLKTGAKPPQPALQRLSIGVTNDKARREAQRGLDDGKGIAAGMQLTRDLGNLPANVCTPRYLAQAARGLARRQRAIKVRVLGRPAIAKLGMGSFLSVTAGADEPPQLIVIEYRGASRSAAPVALVGKGITFDSGGISLKDPAGMDEMKFDMSGAASVIGTFAAAAALKIPLNLVGVIPACENLPSGRATKPGDIVRSMSGQTIEVLNTDAEGRLILADALTYVRRFKPAVVVDVATLTGACVIALGAHYSGLMSADDELARELVSAGERADDRTWRMPLVDDYGEQLKSNFADFANTGGREGGAITAAVFLSKFTQGMRWAHMDIAGVAWLTGAQKSSTGRPVPLLVDFLLQRARQARA